MNLVMASVAHLCQVFSHWRLLNVHASETQVTVSVIECDTHTDVHGPKDVVFWHVVQ